MTQRIQVDLDNGAMIASMWNSPAGRAVDSRTVEAGSTPMLLFIEASGFLDEQELAALQSAIEGSSTKVRSTAVLLEVQVPDDLVGREWCFHMCGHLRSDAVRNEINP